MLEQLPRRFRDKINISGGCWVWTAAITNNGYGRVKIKGKTVVAHKAVFQLLVGPVRDGLTLDHKCRNRACVNPDHLEPVTMRVNVLRGETITGANSRKSHCHVGHPLAGDNLFIRNDGRRRCKTCEAASQRKLRSKPAFKARHAAYERNRRAILKEIRNEKTEP